MRVVLKPEYASRDGLKYVMSLIHSAVLGPVNGSPSKAHNKIL